VKYLISWLPTYYIIKDIIYLQNPSYRGIISLYGPIIVLAVAIPQKKLLLYYTENPYYLRRYTKIYKPLKDIIIKIAKIGKLYK
ncbi:hypothetical protein V2W45_1240944, partial [Cenococcum geophilum]